MFNDPWNKGPGLRDLHDCIQLIIPRCYGIASLKALTIFDYLKAQLNATGELPEVGGQGPEQTQTCYARTQGHTLKVSYKNSFAYAKITHHDQKSTMKILVMQPSCV